MGSGLLQVSFGVDGGGGGDGGGDGGGLDGVVKVCYKSTPVGLNFVSSVPDIISS